MPVVLHSVPTWLEPTQTWLHQQIRHLPPDIVSHIAADDTAHLDRFPVERLHTLGTLPFGRRLVERALRRLGRRSARHLLRETALAVRADVQHSHFGSVGWLDLEAVRASGARHVVTFYGADVTWLPRHEPVWAARYVELFAEVDVVLCEGPHMAGAVGDLGCPAGKIRVHHLGVPVREIAFRPRTFGPGGPLRALVCGSFVEKKGIEDAVHALGRFRREHPVELTIIGDALDDPRSRGQRERIARAIESSGMEGATRRLGLQPHAVFYEEAYRHHLLLAPSVVARDGDTEGGAPVTIIEALATGMPVLATTHCDIPEVVTHEVSGLLGPERDVEALVAHLRAMVARPERWAAMAAAGRRRVEAEFDVVVQAERAAALYRELTACGRR